MFGVKPARCAGRWTRGFSLTLPRVWSISLPLRVSKRWRSCDSFNPIPLQASPAAPDCFPIPAGLGRGSPASDFETIQMCAAPRRAPLRAYAAPLGDARNTSWFASPARFGRCWRTRGF